MPKVITRKLEFIQFLTDSRPIDSLPGRPYMLAAWKVSADGLSLDPWESDSIFNAFDSLEKFEFYFLQSDRNNLGYVLYSDPDQVPPNLLPPTPTPTSTLTPTPTLTPTSTPTRTPTSTLTPTPTLTPTLTSTPAPYIVMTSPPGGVSPAQFGVVLVSEPGNTLSFNSLYDFSGLPANMNVYVSDVQVATVTFTHPYLGMPFAFAAISNGSPVEYQSTFVGSFNAPGRVDFYPPVPTPTQNPTLTLTSTPTLTPTLTNTPTPTLTNTPTLTSTPTLTPTSTPTPTQIGYNYANYNRVADWNGQDGNLTTVGTNGGPSYYGTFDQSGNVWEWNEAASGTSRCIRGGSWVSVAPSVDFQTFYISSSYRTFYGASNRAYDVGFRVASSLNPLSISNFVSVGDVLGSADTTTYGSVNYAYQISKYTVTQSQYVEFLNAVAEMDTYGLYNTNMDSNSRGGITRSSVAGRYFHSFKASMGDKPVNFVNWLACARYCNWLHNGRPTGSQNASTTENGAYAISGTSATKISGASYWIPTENEWYKAAYFSIAKNGGLGGYWKYATQSDADPTPVSSNPTGDGPFVPA